jgi:hypothetical protein
MEKITLITDCSLSSQLVYAEFAIPQWVLGEMSVGEMAVGEMAFRRNDTDF